MSTRNSFRCLKTSGSRSDSSDNRSYKSLKAPGGEHSTRRFLISEFPLRNIVAKLSQLAGPLGRELGEALQPRLCPTGALAALATPPALRVTAGDPFPLRYPKIANALGIGIVVAHIRTPAHGCDQIAVHVIQFDVLTVEPIVEADALIAGVVGSAWVGRRPRGRVADGRLLYRVWPRNGNRANGCWSRRRDR